MGIPFRIEICGGIASGKTTLANLLKGHAEVVLENFTATPFWEPFYETPGRYSFEAEVSFLLQHYHQIKRQRFDGSESITVCDFSYSLDRAYSAVSLEAGEFRAFEAVYQRVRADSAAPALLIQLRCSPETQMRRIEARARRPTRSEAGSCSSVFRKRRPPTKRPRFRCRDESGMSTTNPEKDLCCGVRQG